MALPQVSSSGFLPPSRSTSTTRKAQPVTTPSYGFESHQPYPSPSVPQNSYGEYSLARPGSLSRQTSYGFARSNDQANSIWNTDDGMGMAESSGNAYAGPSSPSVMGGSYDAFASDAFAPLNRQDESDPWARMRSAQSAFNAPAKQAPESSSSNPWAAFGRSTNGFGTYQLPNAGSSQQRYGGGRMPTPPDEDDEMMSDEEEDEDDMPQARYGSEPAGQSGVEAAMAAEKRALSMSGLNEQERVAALWQRGRRKT